MRPPRSPQSDRRNLLNSAHRDFKSKRVERVIDEIGAPPSQHAPCPPRLSGIRFHDLCSRFKRDNKDSALSSIRNLLSFRFQRSKRGRVTDSMPGASKVVGYPVRDSASGSKGRVSKVTLCTPPPAGSSAASAADNGLTPRTGRQIHPGLSAGVLMAWRVICHPKPPPK